VGTLIYDGVTQVEVPEDPEYHFTTDMTTRPFHGPLPAGTDTRQAFFMYYAPGATHAPHTFRKRGLKNTRASLTKVGIRSGSKPGTSEAAWNCSAKYEACS